MIVLSEKKTLNTGTVGCVPVIRKVKCELMAILAM